MALNEQALAVLSARRAELDALLANLDVQLVGAWVNAWDTLSIQFEQAYAELMLQAKGGKVRGTTVARNMRLRQALEQAAAVLNQLAADAATSAAAAASSAALSAAQSQIDAIRAQLPPEMLDGLAATWTRVDQTALDAIVRRTAEQIHSALLPLSDDAVAAMRNALVRGITVGENPRRVAKEILRNTERQFNGGLTRAMTITRTEMLDAHRAAGKAHDNAAREVVKGWVWLSKLDTKTCPSCVAQHGEEHPLDEDGPLDHQCGRCSRGPVTKSWKDLGFDIEEPPSLVPDAQAWYDNLTPGSQRRLMGPARQEMLANGSITLRDLTTRRSTPGWRDSMHVTPVRDLRTLGGANG